MDSSKNCINSLIEIRRFLDILRADGDLPSEGYSFDATFRVARGNDIVLVGSGEVLIRYTDTKSIFIHIMQVDEFNELEIPCEFDAETNWMKFLEDALIIHTFAADSQNVLIWIRKNHY